MHPVVGPEGAVIQSGDIAGITGGAGQNSHEINKPELNTEINIQVTKVEDTKENGVPGPAGTKEAKD